uniref:Uncharacterized protein n=1 Tax=Quercus lobata TaxID=97700 RepID=A0A7N2L7D2_QUELO
MDELIPTIRTALCDSMPEVRESAGLAFRTLYKVIDLFSVLIVYPFLVVLDVFVLLAIDIIHSNATPSYN